VCRLQVAAFHTDADVSKFNAGVSKSNHFFLVIALQPPVAQSLPISEASCTYSDMPQSVEILWTSDQPNAKLLRDNTQQ
jgi:hypothetical protein